MLAIKVIPGYTRWQNRGFNGLRQNESDLYYWNKNNIWMNNNPNKISGSLVSQKLKKLLNARCYDFHTILQ